MSHFRMFAPLLGLAALVATPGCAAAGPATPDNVNAVIAGARAGDVIRLTPGSYGQIVVKKKAWKPALVIEAGDAVIDRVTLEDVTGLHWRGGRFDGRDSGTTGLSMGRSNDVRVEGGDFRNYTRNGVIVIKSRDVIVRRNNFSNMGSDGMQVAQAQRVLIEGNHCEAFRPTEKAHPDCVQMWSRPDLPPTSDIIIRGNTMTGIMQGVSMFNHARNGVDDGGFDRVTVIGNDVKISTYYHGIAAYNCRECLIRDNRVETIPSANPKARAWIKTAGDGSVTMCGNKILSFPTWDGQQKCKASDPTSIPWKD